jgi:hypothetical protein
LAAETGEKTAEGNRSLQEVSQAIRAAGKEDLPSAPEDKDREKLEAEGKKEIGEERTEDKQDPRAETEKDPGEKVSVPPAANDDAVVTNPEIASVPEPTQKTPEEMAQDPETYLEPRNPEFEAQVSIPAENKLNEGTLKDMGADREITKSMNEYKQATVPANTSKPMQRIDTQKEQKE